MNYDLVSAEGFNQSQPGQRGRLKCSLHKHSAPEGNSKTDTQPVLCDSGKPLCQPGTLRETVKLQKNIRGNFMFDDRVSLLALVTLTLCFSFFFPFF